MKKLALIVLSVLGSTFLNAQSLNDKGLYVDSDGELFNGTLSKTSNGIKSDFTVKEGIVSGPVTYLYASGNLMEKGIFVDGKKDQQWTRYNENGTVSAIAFYNLGKKTGTWLVYDDAGKKRFEMNYSDGEKTGMWTSWDENGEVSDTKDYSKVN